MDVLLIWDRAGGDELTWDRATATAATVFVAVATPTPSPPPPLLAILFSMLAIVLSILDLVVFANAFAFANSRITPEQIESVTETSSPLDR
jgi:hypothetical protein